MDIFSLENLVTLAMLILLQAVLGFDNLLYISLESKRAPADKQSMVRHLGIGIAVVFRILLLLVLMKVIDYFQNPIFDLQWTSVLEGTFNLHSLIVLLGGVLIIYTATKEILHIDDYRSIGRRSSRAKFDALRGPLDSDHEPGVFL